MMSRRKLLLLPLTPENVKDPAASLTKQVSAFHHGIGGRDAPIVAASIFLTVLPNVYAKLIGRNCILMMSQCPRLSSVEHLGALSRRYGTIVPTAGGRLLTCELALAAVIESANARTYFMDEYPIRLPTSDLQALFVSLVMRL